jgi:hypothetical protein
MLVSTLVGQASFARVGAIALLSFVAACGGGETSALHQVDGRWLADAVWCLPVGLP